MHQAELVSMPSMSGWGLWQHAQQNAAAFDKVIVSMPSMSGWGL